jgi:poly(3-hydroxyalkanoate) synthetase
MKRQYFALEALHISTMYSEMIVLCSWLEESGRREETIDSPDLLYWNADRTRMARAAHSFYLRTTYLENNLAKLKKVILNPHSAVDGAHTHFC